MAQNKAVQSESIKLPTFSKEQIVTSKKYLAHKDLLNALLAEDREYTKQDIEDLMKQYLESEVK